MDFDKVCRTCLGEASLNPIFLDNKDIKRYTSTLFLTTGVKVALNDGLPQNICTICINYLNNSIKFRTLCRDTEKKLLALQNEIKEQKYEEVKITKTITDTQVRNFEIKIEIDSDARLVKSETEGTEIIEEDDKPSLQLKETEKFQIYECNDYVENEICIELTEENKLKEEIRNESVTEEFEAEYLEEFDNETIVTEHVLSDKDPNRVVCKFCYKDLAIRSLDAHIARTHPGADKNKVKCELCDTYVTKEKLNRHKIIMHGNGVQKKCGYCKTEFESKEALIEHVATCTAKKKRRKPTVYGREIVECDICNKSMQKASLKLHKAVKHAGLGPVCEHCGKRFGNKLRLNEHYRAKHGYDKLKCSYCEFNSASAMAMRNHERRHRGEKPFVCDTCGAKFHANYLLSQHKQSHRTEKLLKCDLCPASFKANNSLHMHKQTCHSTSLYKCSMCTRVYSCRHYAVKHLRKVHQFSGPVPPLQRVSPSEVPITA